MSPASRSKSKDKKVGKEPPKASLKSSGLGNAGASIPASAYDPHLQKFHGFEPTPIASAPPLQSNGRFRSIDDTEDNCGSSLGTGGEYDAASINGSWSGDEDQKEKASNPPVRQDAIPGADNDKREKIRQKNERKHQRQKERRAQELHERCSGYLMSRKLESLAQQLVAMGFSSERATMALILNEGRVEESVSWLFEGGEEADDHRSENLEGGANLKIDITEELAKIAGLEISYNCSKQEVERAIVASEGDIAKAEETLRAQRQDPPSTPPNLEETDDTLTINNNGKLPVPVSQNPLRPSTKSSLSSSMPERRDDKDFKYAKSSPAIGVPSEPGSKNLQPLKGIQTKLEWGRQQQQHQHQIAMQEDRRLLTAGSNSSHSYSVASPLHVLQQTQVKTEMRYAAIGNEFKSLQPGPVREPVIVMQRPQSINLKQVASSSTGMNSSSSPPGTAAGWYHGSTFEIAKSNGLSPNIPSTRSLHLSELSANQLYHQQQQQRYHQLNQQFVPGSSPTGNGPWSRASTSPTLAAASSLGLFSGLGSTASSGASSPVDWSTTGGGQIHLDYTNIDWSLDRNLSNGRTVGGLWQGVAASLVNNSNNSANAASVGGGNHHHYHLTQQQQQHHHPTMRIVVPPNRNGMAMAGRQGGGSASVAAVETPAGRSREWTSPFEERDLFSFPRRFVFSPTL